MYGHILPHSFYARDTVTVAQELLGACIVRHFKSNLLVAAIVETEAYCYPNDPASHTYRGKTVRNAAMFGPVGHAYVYFIYGNHYCLNVVAHTKEAGAGGVLIRAVQPLSGMEIMHTLRHVRQERELTNGPGKLTKALAITKEFNHHNLLRQDSLYLTQGIAVAPEHIVATPRIGITQATDKLWRFYIHGNRYVSRP